MALSPVISSPRGQVWAMLIGWSKILQPWGGLWVWSTRLQRRPGEVRLHLCLRRAQCSSPQGQTRQKFDCATDRRPKHRTCAFAGSWCLCFVTQHVRQSSRTVPGFRAALVDADKPRRIAALSGPVGSRRRAQYTHPRIGTCVANMKLTSYLRAGCVGVGPGDAV